jgi:putative flippase GtrA
MTLSENKLTAPLWNRLRTKVGKRFTRFVGVAVLALAASQITLTICDGIFHTTATTAALLSWFAGAVVSYVLSRWAWERKGRPDVLRETIPFWVISAMVIVILTTATKFAYHSATWMHLHGIKHVLWVNFIWLCANFCTFLLRFVIFHYVLFAERAPVSAARAAATAEGGVGPEIHHGVPRPEGTHVNPVPPATGATGSAAQSAPSGQPAPSAQPRKASRAAKRSAGKPVPGATSD